MKNDLPSVWSDQWRASLSVMILIYAALVLQACHPGAEITEPSKASQNIEPPDAIYNTGQIWTGNPDQPWANALAITDGRISAIGEQDAVSRGLSSATKIYDLPGQFIVPGFQDSHLHIMYMAAPQVDLAGAETLDALQNRLKSFAEANPSFPWVLGFGWGYSAFPDQAPLARYLDEVIPDRPAFIISRDGHMALANGRAMELAGATPDTEDPENGVIVRHADGTLTGEFQEKAMDLIRDFIPSPTEDQRYAALLRNSKRAAAAGLTALHEAGVEPENIPLFARAEAEGHLLQRVDLALRMVTPTDRNTVPQAAIQTHLDQATEFKARFESDTVRIRSIKGMLDGTIDATTAAMFDPYIGTDARGALFWETDVLRETVARYDAAGFQIILHAIGDRAIAQALDAFDYTQSENPARVRRHRIEHVEMPRSQDLSRFRALGVVASTQPMFAYPDATVLTNFEPLLGPDRAPRADNFALWDQAGVRQVFGSDFPVMTLSVLSGIEAAVTRMTEDGTPEGGWHPAGRISLDAALRHYTVDAAWAVGDGEDRGVLAIGQQADFVILSQNLFDIDPTRISETDIMRTVVGGRITYDAVDP